MNSLYIAIAVGTVLCVIVKIGCDLIVSDMSFLLDQLKTKEASLSKDLDLTAPRLGDKKIS